MLPEYRLEIQFVCHVEIRGDRFRIAIDHDGLISGFFGCDQSVHAGIIEFNALANPVGAGAKDNYFLLVAYNGFIDRVAFPSVDRGPFEGRSEEHTSELQSLMRISYAVFYLKKTNTS